MSVIHFAVAASYSAHQSTWQEFRHYVSVLHHWIPIGLVGAVSWVVWVTRFSLSRVYRPVPAGYMTTTSVVVPSFREDPDILARCLDTWLAEDPTEIIVVPDI